MKQDKDDVFYYITVMNENYAHPGLKEGHVEGILKGMYRFKSLDKGEHRVQLLGSGTILREVIADQQNLEDDWDVGSEVWICISFTALRRDGLGFYRSDILIS